MDTRWKSVEEISRVYQDHLDSLALSGLPFDEMAVRAEWDLQVHEFLNPTD